jgi:hypothetical protein
MGSTLVKVLNFVSDRFPSPLELISSELERQYFLVVIVLQGVGYSYFIKYFPV